MCNNLKLSIIIPCYNAEKNIYDCLTRILHEQINSSLKSDELEILIINDGSTDNTHKIIEEKFSLPNVHLINKENEGVSIARNIGIKKAKGKWIAFIDADDYLDNGSLPKLIEIGENTNSDVIAFQYRLVSPHSNVYGTNTPVEISKPTDGISYIHNTNGLTWRTPVWAYLFNTQFLQSNNILFANDILYYEDCIFMWNVCVKAKLIHIVNNIFYNYVQVPGSCMHDYTKIHLLKLNDCTIPLLRELDKLRRLQRDEIKEYIIRDKNSFVFGHIYRSIKYNLGYNRLKHDIDRFESMGLYPTADLTKYPGYGSLGHKILKKVINNRITLTALYIYFKITNIF